MCACVCVRAKGCMQGMSLDEPDNIICKSMLQVEGALPDVVGVDPV